LARRRRHMRPNSRFDRIGSEASAIASVPASVQAARACHAANTSQPTGANLDMAFNAEAICTI
jgi:hypothetical protein